MNIFTTVREEVFQALRSLENEGKIPVFNEDNLKKVAVEAPRDASFGDVATNICLVMSSKAGMKPRDLAELLTSRLRENPFVETTQVAGAGFINMRLSEKFWTRQLETILKEGVHYGDSTMGGGEKVNVEFTSANPTGPLHVGHSRGAVFGDALSSLLQKAGYDVTREYYINDAGAQVAKLARSAYLRYLEALGQKIGEIPAGLYPGEYLKEVGAFIAQKDGEKWVGVGEEEYLPYFKKTAADLMMEMIKKDLAQANIHFDVFSSEKAIADSGAVEKVMDFLDKEGLIYKGVLEKPKGAKAADDWEPKEMTIFKSTLFGDEVDRPLCRSDGSYTYFTPDIAYQLDKYKRGFKKLIMVLGADHAGYVARMKAAVKAVTKGDAQIDFLLCQMINFTDNGQPVKMSKRAGTFVTFKDLLDEVGTDVVRFYLLTRKQDSQLDFDFAKVKEQSKDNPVFYVQYAHARGASVKRLAEETFGKKADELIASADLSLLQEDELAVVRQLALWPRQVEMAAAANEPHRLAYFLNDVAAAFHGLWNRGREDVSKRFIEAKDEELSKARLALVAGVMTVIESGLAVFGVAPAEEM